MSTIVCLKEKRSLVLGTDSRQMQPDLSGVKTDVLQKIHEIAPSTFVATSGYERVCGFQERRAPELAEELGTTDIRAIAERLQQESIPRVRDLGEVLSGLQHVHEHIRAYVSGESLIHGTALVGWTADRRLGWVIQSYRLRDGKVEAQSGEYFGDRRAIYISMGDMGRQHLAQDRLLFTGRPVWVVQRILATVKRECPLVGGLDQIVRLDDNGAHWISAPVQREVACI